MKLIIAHLDVLEQMLPLLGISWRGFDILTLKEKTFEIELHPDVQMCNLGAEMILSPQLYHALQHRFSLDFKADHVICGRSNPSKNYPEDVIYNIVKIGGSVFYKNMDEAVRRCAMDKYTLVDVKQGYAKCSTIVLNQNAVITEDENLFDVYASRGIDVLKVEKGHVALEGFEYGFIGGASLVMDDRIYFFGPIEAHPDFKRIASFLEKWQFKFTALNFGALTDLGGGFFINYD